MALTTEQQDSFQDNGYLPYTRVLSDVELGPLRQRCEDIAYGRAGHVPPRYVQLEAAFRDTEDTETDSLDQVRKMTHLCYFDDLFEAVARKAEIVDVIEELLGPNLKLVGLLNPGKAPPWWACDTPRPTQCALFPKQVTVLVRNQYR